MSCIILDSRRRWLALFGKHRNLINKKKRLISSLQKNDFFRAFLHIAHRKQYEQGESSALIQPFKGQVWMAIIAWILISDLCILIHNYFIFKIILKRKFIWTNHLFFAFYSFTNQCGIKIPNITVFRISAIMTRAVPLLVVSVYSATFLSFVKVKTIRLPFEDIDGLVQDGTFKIGFENGTFLDGFFWVISWQ